MKTFALVSIGKQFQSLDSVCLAAMHLTSPFLFLPSLQSWKQIDLKCLSIPTSTLVVSLAFRSGLQHSNFSFFFWFNLRILGVASLVGRKDASGGRSLKLEESDFKRQAFYHFPRYNTQNQDPIHIFYLSLVCSEVNLLLGSGLLLRKKGVRGSAFPYCAVTSFKTRTQTSFFLASQQSPSSTKHHPLDPTFPQTWNPLPKFVSIQFIED